MDLPHRVVVGASILEKINEFLEIPAGKALIITGRKTWEIAGKRIYESLEASQIVEHVFIDKPLIEEAEKISERYKDFDLFIGVGGGKNIDIAKYSAYITNKPFVSVPTNASNDGIASHIASLYDSEGIRRSIPTKPPMLVLADVEVISKAPQRFIRAGVGDALSNLTAVRDRILAYKLRGEYFSEYAAELSRLSAELVLKYAPIIKEGLLEGIRVLIKSLISSGVAMAIAGSSRPASGAEHLFAHALERLRPGAALHGELVGVGTIMMSYLHGMDRKAIREALLSVGAPVDYRGLNVEPIDIIRALTMAHKIRKRYTILGESGISRKAAVRLAERTLVIPRGAVDDRDQES